MPAFIVTFIIGVVCIILGISNMRGNISSLHSYHRHRVSEEDRIPFGKKGGLWYNYYRYRHCRVQRFNSNHTLYR